MVLPKIVILLLYPLVAIFKLPRAVIFSCKVEPEPVKALTVFEIGSVESVIWWMKPVIVLSKLVIMPEEF